MEEFKLILNSSNIELFKKNRKYYELRREQSINENTRIRKHILGGVIVKIISKPIAVYDSWSYTLQVRGLWKYLNYRWLKKCKSIKT